MKQENDNNWLNEIREELKDFEADVPADSWEKLASELDSEVSPSLSTFASAETTASNYTKDNTSGNKQDKTIFVWNKNFWGTIAASILALIGIGTATNIFDFGTKHSNVAETIAALQCNATESATVIEENADETSESNNNLNVEYKNTTNNKKQNLFAQNKSTAQSKPSATKNNNDIITVAMQRCNGATLAEDAAAEKDDIEEKETQQNISYTDTLPALQNFEEERLLAAFDDSETKAKSKLKGNGKWNLGVIVGRNGNIDLDFLGSKEELIMNDVHQNHWGTEASPHLPQPQDSTQINNGEETRATRALSGEEIVEEVVDSKNHQAWSFGLSVQKQLTKHLAIETGLVYTLLTSDVTIEKQLVSDYIYKGRKNVSQSLHYIGIPLKLNDVFYRSRHWNIYFGGGVLLDYCVSASRGSESLSVPNKWQFSTRADIGAQYNFTKGFGIYIEPGVTYYVTTNKSIPTLHTKQPVTFNLNAGFRFEL